MSSAVAAWVAVWLAVSMQIGAGAVAQAEPDPAMAALAAAIVVCHGGHDQGHHDAPLRRHLAEPVILQASVAALQALAMLQQAPCLPAPSQVLDRVAAPPQARAPPGCILRAFYARGPPHTV